MLEPHLSLRHHVEVARCFQYHKNIMSSTTTTTVVSNEPSLKGLTAKDYAKVKPHQHAGLQDLVRHHVDSFNFFLDEGLRLAVQDLRTQEIYDPSNRKIQFFIEDAMIGYPSVPETNVHAHSIQLYPSECREGGTSYKAHLNIVVQFLVDGVPVNSVNINMGQIPIMVKSKRCRLYNLTPTELLKHHEETEEFGGYFIINGNERLIRMLIVPRRNYPLAIIRNSWIGKGPLFTEYGVMMRSVSKDQSQCNITLHYRSDGSITLAFARNKELFYIPIVFVLKALVEVPDVHIYKQLIKEREDDAFLKDCIASMLRFCLGEGVVTRGDAQRYIGQRFKVKSEMPPWASDENVCQQLMKEHICIHLSKNIDKFNTLIFMSCKLYSLADGRCHPESADSPMNQEILLGGHLYLMILKERLNDYLVRLKSEIERKYNLQPEAFSIDDSTKLKTIAVPRINVGTSLEAFIGTGNLRSRSGLNLQQVAGFTIVADKLNFFRYLSHFRSVHRGAFFAQMRTTGVRKLLPEAWGFICPVHTPDGTPCGLLNHLAALCQVVTATPQTAQIPRLLCSLGMTPLSSPLSRQPDTKYLDVLLDGRVLGYISEKGAIKLTNGLRVLKAKGEESVPPTLEIGYVPVVPNGQYAGVFLFTTPARMMRPVTNLTTNTKELIGSFEQVYLNVAVCPEEINKEVTTHIELHDGSMLSAISSFTPFSDFNQSPRNMYQCQMGKQTIGVPCHTLNYRSDNKIYYLQTPQAPMVRPYLYDFYNVDNYPLGTNAIVAVISYTGYDMEDAMILNRAAFQRGFAYASVYKCEFIDLGRKSKDNGNAIYHFGTLPNDKMTNNKLDSDGLPPVGALLNEGDPMYSYIDVASMRAIVTRYKSHEPAYVDQVKLLGEDTGVGYLQRVMIKLRINRNPIIGDKFASRHGQKGVCSQKWPVEDMPFAESGMVPDIIFNPHGFPSRMTIGMMIESMAGKSAALHGICHDATPFTFSESTPAVDYFGQHLLEAGYNYYGNERLYSGVDGREFEADIFFGVVYYQRLRHMVSDKFQVRTTGPIDILTHQPVKGRKRAGGIRFGEMERDSLLAHGSSFLLQDRLLNCSDKSYTHVCRTCGSILSPVLTTPISSNDALQRLHDNKWACRNCGDKGQIELIAVPYVFRYLVAELSGMNINLKIGLSP